MTLKKSLPFKILPLALAVGLIGCGDDNVDPEAINAPDTYTFDSRTLPGSSSVNYSEAISRHLLIKELDYIIGSDFLQQFGDENAFELRVTSLLNKIYKSGTSNLTFSNLYTSEESATPINGINSQIQISPATFAGLSQSVNLQDKIPGIYADLIYRNEEFEDWGDLIGWNLYNTPDEDILPDALIQDWFTQVARLAIDGNPDTRFEKNTINYRSLITHFLNVSITYSQSMNVHLSQTTILNASNSPATDEPATDLQKQWDMAFGYFGANQSYLFNLSDTSRNQFDNNADGEINLFSEYNFDNASQAALTDSKSYLAETDFSKTIIKSFLTGRQLIDDNILTPKENFRNSLYALAKNIKLNWEKALSARIISNLNRAITLVQFYPQEIDSINSTYREVWGELKAYSLALQFNNSSIIDKESIEDVHLNLGQNTSVLNVNDYARQLVQAKEILRTTYGFSRESADNW